MGMKQEALAGWSLFLILLFLSAFYIVAGNLLALPAAWGPRISVALIEFSAFTGGALLLRASVKDKAFSRRRRPRSRVYTSFIILTAICASLLVFLINFGIAYIVKENYRGIASFYPMLSGTAKVPPVYSIIFLVIIPAVSQEIFFRGSVFRLLEKNGTTAAILVTALGMPMLYIFPAAAPALFAIGLICGFVFYYTKSLRAAMLIHILCRLSLYAGDMMYASDRLDNITMYFVIAAAVLFLLFLFSALRSYEGLLKDDLIPHFEKGPKSTAENIWNSFANIGFLLFLLLYIVRLVMILYGV